MREFYSGVFDSGEIDADADRWEGVVYVVKDQHGDLTVYKVCPETQTGPIWTLHRDLLLSCGTL